MHKLALVLLIALTGCAPLAYRDVTGQRRGSDAFAMDSAQCQSDARTMAAVQGGGSADADLASGARFTRPQQRQRNYDSCMRSKGWAS
jgi:hypothetical protein